MSLKRTSYVGLILLSAFLSIGLLFFRLPIVCFLHGYAQNQITDYSVESFEAYEKTAAGNNIFLFVTIFVSGLCACVSYYNLKHSTVFDAATVRIILFVSAFTTVMLMVLGYLSYLMPTGILS